MDCPPRIISNAPLTLGVSGNLTLRQLTPRDTPNLYRALNDLQTKRDILEFLAWSASDFTLDGCLKNIIETSLAFKEGLALSIMGVHQDGQLIGVVSLFDIKHLNESNELQAEMGFWLRHDQTGQGIITRCALALAYYGFTERNIGSIIILCHPNNHRANRVAELVGATYEGLQANNGNSAPLSQYRLLPKNIGL